MLKYSHLHRSSSAKCASTCLAVWLKKCELGWRLLITSSMIYSLRPDFFPLFAYRRFSRCVQVRRRLTEAMHHYQTPQMILAYCFFISSHLHIFPWHANATVNIGAEFCFGFFLVFHLSNVLMIHCYFPSRAIHNDACGFYSFAGTPVNYPVGIKMITVCVWVWRKSISQLLAISKPYNCNRD